MFFLFCADTLVKEAKKQTNTKVTYDPTYYKIPYPNGDVPENCGVCTDVIVRAYRKTFNIDLQKLVHEDMKKCFTRYPKLWGLKSCDTNIDHRRVPNLETFFERFGEKFPITQNPRDYTPGDIVTWDLGNHSIPHIGIVSDQKTASGVPMIIHNIGDGPKTDDILYQYKIRGHFRYFPKAKA